MAEKVVTLHLVFTRGDVTACPDCTFDSLEHMTVHILTDTGVRDRAYDYCPRCR